MKLFSFEAAKTEARRLALHFKKPMYIFEAKKGHLYNCIISSDAFYNGSKFRLIGRIIPNVSIRLISNEIMTGSLYIEEKAK